MAGGSKDLRYNVTVDASDASSSLKKLGTDVKKTAKDIEGSFDDSASAGDKFKATVDELSGKLESEFKSAAQAADKLGAALKDAGSKMDLGDAIADLKRMGFTFDEIAADADKFASSLKQLDDVKLAGVKELDGVAPGLSKKLDDVGKSADSSKSVLANMVGNSAQDLSALGGIAGSAGVAIGQMGEYMADARAEGEGFGSIVGNFATIAGPMAAISVGISLVTGALETMKKRQEAAAKTTRDLADDMAASFEKVESAADIGLDDTADIVDRLGVSFLKTQDDAGAVVDALLKIGSSAKNTGDVLNQLQTEAGRREFFTGFIENGGRMVGVTRELAVSLADAIERGHGFAEVSAHMLSNQAPGTREFLANNKSMIAALEALDEAGQRVDISKVIGDTTNELLAAKGGAEALAAAYDELGPDADPLALLNRSLEIYNDNVTAAATETRRLERAGDAVDEWADKGRKAFTAMNDLNVLMSSAKWGKTALDGAVSAMSDYSDQLFGLRNIHADAEKAFDDLAKSVKENGKSFDGNTDKSRANLAALEDVASALDTRFSAAYATAGGNLDAFKGSAGEIADQTLQRLKKELGLTDAQTAALGKTLGLTEGDYEARFHLAGAAEAQAKLDLLNISLDDFDDPVARQAYMDAIVRGDYVLALQIAGVMNEGNKRVAYDVYTRYHTSGDRGSVGATPPEGVSGKATTATVAPVVTNTKTAQRQLDHLVRPRTARINVALVPSSVLVRVNGGG